MVALTSEASTRFRKLILEATQEFEAVHTALVQLTPQYVQATAESMKMRTGSKDTDDQQGLADFAIPSERSAFNAAAFRTVALIANGQQARAQSELTTASDGKTPTELRSHESFSPPGHAGDAGPVLDGSLPLAMSNFQFDLRPEWLEPPAASGVWGQEFDDRMMRMQALQMMEHSARDGTKEDICGLIFIAYDILVIPLEAFDPEDGWLRTMMDWTTLIFWTLDIILTFFTGYYSEGVLVLNHASVARRYLKKWFLIDLFVVVPDWVFIVLGSSSNSKGLGRVLRSSRAARMLRLIRVAKLRRLKALLFDMVNSEYTFLVLQVLQLLLYILLMNHYIACGWYLIGRMGKLQKARPNWLEDVGITPVWGESLAWRYFTSLHWSITQCMSAPMDIYATNLPERVFSIVVLFWALVALSSIIASVTSSVTAVRTLDSDEMRNFWMLRRYLQQKKISSATTLRVVRYLEHKTEMARRCVMVSKVTLLEQISEQLQLELTNEMSAPVLLDHPFFKYVSDEMPMIMFRLCSQALKPTPMAIGDSAFQDGDWAANMFFVAAGLFSYKLASPEVEDCELQQRMWVSEAVLWMHWQHLGTLVTKRPGELMLLQPEPFADIVRVHPRPWFFAKRYAEAFANLVNGMEVQALSDLLFSKEFFTSVVQEYAQSAPASMSGTSPRLCRQQKPAPLASRKVPRRNEGALTSSRQLREEWPAEAPPIRTLPVDAHENCK